MRIIFAGTPEVALPALRALLDSEHEIVAVLTRPDAPKGRGRGLHPSPVAVLALEAGIEVLRPRTLKARTQDGEEFRKDLQRLAPDCVPVVAYGNLIPRDVLDMVPHGFINLHFSKLPRWRGAAPVQAAIITGDTETGATTFRIDEGLDTGDILGMLSEPISPEDTAGTLLERLAYKGAPLLVETLDGLAAGTLSPRPQPEEGVEHAAKITVADAQVGWRRSAEEVDRQIRAYTPTPGAWALLGETRVKLGPVRPAPEVAGLGPGELKVEKKRVLAGTDTHAVELSTIQIPGKKMMNTADWARGLADTTGLELY